MSGRGALDPALDAAPIATLVIRQRRVVHANAAALRLLERTADQLIGQAYTSFVPPEELERVADRQARRLRGEPAPGVYETTVQAGSVLKSVQLHLARAGDAIVVQMLDVTGEAVRRLRLTALARFGATVQREASHEDVYRAVRDALGTLGLEFALFRPHGVELRLEAVDLVPSRRAALEEALGRPLEVTHRPWMRLDRDVWAQGAAFDDEWRADGNLVAPGELARPAPAVPDVAAIGVRVDVGGAPEALLYATAPWLRAADVPTFRLFGAQISAALDAASSIGTLSRRNAELGALNRVAEAAATATELPAFLERASTEVCALVGCELLAFFLHDRGRGEAQLLHLAGGDDGARRELQRVPLDGALAAPAPDGGPAVRYLADLPDGTTRTTLARLELETVATVPLRFRSALLGTMAVAFRARCDAAGCRTDLLQAVAAHFAAGIETYRLLGDLRGRVSELTLLNDIAIATASVDPVLLIENAVRRVMVTLRADAGGAFLLRDQVMEQLVAIGISPETRARMARLPLGVGSLSDAVRDRRTAQLEALDDRTSAATWMREHEGLRTVVTAPLLVKDRAIGALTFGRRRPEPFSDAELALLTAIGVQLGVAYEHARLFDETRRRAEELGLLLEVGRTLVATLDLDQVLDAGIRNMARIADAPAGFLLLPDPTGDRLVIRASSPPSLVGRSLPLRGRPSLASWVFDRRAPVVVEDAVGDPRVDPELREASNGRAYLAVPLVVRDRAIGAVTIVDPRGPRRFTQPEVDRAAAIANQLAVAVENARLYADLRRSYADLAQAQDRLVRQERLAALGELAAVVAHEVRNPLGVIFNSLGSLRRMLKPSGDARMLFDIVGEEAARLNRIIGDLLHFAKPSPPTLRPEPLARVVDEAVAAALAGAPPGIALHREVDEDGLPPVPIDAQLMRQAVLNIAQNAVQAMSDGGTLTVRVRRAGDAALVEVGDTGPGIPDQVRHRVFEPFFTTRATGTGLGLAIVKRIVDDHRGRIAVRSGEDGGTVFSVRLPLEAPGVMTTG